ncbi:DUF5665 domain-containing protein [Cochlodiniinecator piscidefendens]|uniref:DUF5665 domain-containing protein n=1 Tax=Cochlodiniinecator piscidefendens TaxID=2715756 RepID=UPI00140DFE7C|nr:DUF5665 domain-containing protein [Cochlodiniinecator piscidefendens]
MTEKPEPNQDELHTELSLLRKEVAHLNNNRFVRLYNSLWKLIGFQFLRGLAFGFGTVVGATILVSALAYSLSKIDFIPVIGNWAAEIAKMIQEPRNP